MDIINAGEGNDRIYAGASGSIVHLGDDGDMDYVTYTYDDFDGQNTCF